MHHKYVFGFVAVLTSVLAACGGGSNSMNATHGDVPTLGITAANALNVAADVYRVTAVDVPHTAAFTMVPGSLTAINPTACASGGGTVSSGSSSGMMGMGMMDMVFSNCQLTSSAPDSGHVLIVNGTCNNTVSSTVATVETVTGDEISFTTLGATMRLHAFSVTRNSDEMTNATGVLHGVIGDDENMVAFSTPTAFVGPASAPVTGALVVTGANNSRLRLSIVSAGVGFTLEVDADGDGVYDDPQPPAEQNWNNVFWSLIP